MEDPASNRATTDGSYVGGDGGGKRITLLKPSVEARFEGLDLHGKQEFDLDLSELEGLIKDVCWLLGSNSLGFIHPSHYVAPRLRNLDVPCILAQESASFGI